MKAQQRATYLTAEELRFAGGSIVDIASVGLPNEPGKLLERPGAARSDFLQRNVMPALGDPDANPLTLQLRRLQDDINHADFKAALLGSDHKLTVFGRREHRLHANRLINLDRFVEPRFDALNGCKIGIVEQQPFTLHDLLRQQVRIDDPDRSSPAFDVGSVVESALAGPVRAGDDPEDWPIRVARRRAHRLPCGAGSP